MIGNPLKIKDIISEMSRGGMRIPEIQRSYVWKRSSFPWTEVFGSSIALKSFLLQGASFWPLL
jgi:hypothetical protein